MNSVRIDFGTYTPTFTNVTNLDASVALTSQWMRVGDVVTVSGALTLDPTAAGAVELGISLPVPSNFSAGQQCGGTAFAVAVAGQGAGIIADATNDRAALRFIAVDTANRTMTYSFTYLVIE
jgi:hypothetical protein